MIRTAIIAAGAVLVLAGCARAPDAPTDRGVCWHAATTRDGKVKFNKLAENVPDMEHCAAQLEAMRLRFMGLGSTATEVAGVYQGNWLFIQREGVFTAEKMDGNRYPFMVRTGDGRLAVPGAMPQQ